MKQRWFQLASLIFFALILQTTSAQELAAWDKDAASKEINGMRRYAWVMSDAIAKTLEKSPADKFPAVHALMRDFREARKGIDPGQPPSKWQTIDVESLAIHNPNYWSAVYEVDPADPLMMWFHATLYAVNGQVQRTFYAQQLAIHSPVDTPLKKEMPRLMVSAGRLITMGNVAVQTGTKLHDQEQYYEAAKVYRDVLSVVPSHSLALYELGYALRKQDSGKKGKAAAQSYFDRAKQCDPFRIEAYQGEFRVDEFKRFQTLRSKAKPSWDEFSQTPPARDSVKQLTLLSSHLQDAGLHDLALLVRQLVVAHREKSFNDDDRRFIETSLKALVPKGDFEVTFKRLSGEREELRINNLTTDE